MKSVDGARITLHSTCIAGLSKFSIKLRQEQRTRCCNVTKACINMNSSNQLFKVVVESLFSFTEDETPLQVMYV